MAQSHICLVSFLSPGYLLTEVGHVIGSNYLLALEPTDSFAIVIGIEVADFGVMVIVAVVAVALFAESLLVVEPLLIALFEFQGQVYCIHRDAGLLFAAKAGIARFDPEWPDSPPLSVAAIEHRMNFADLEPVQNDRLDDHFLLDLTRFDFE